MGKVSSIDDRKILIYRHRRLDTGKIFYVGIAVIPISITEASLAFNIAPGMLSRYLSGKRNNKTTLKYL